MKGQAPRLALVRTLWLSRRSGSSLDVRFGKVKMQDLGPKLAPKKKNKDSQKALCVLSSGMECKQQAGLGQHGTNKQTSVLLDPLRAVFLTLRDAQSTACLFQRLIGLGYERVLSPLPTGTLWTVLWCCLCFQEYGEVGIGFISSSPDFDETVSDQQNPDGPSRTLLRRCVIVEQKPEGGMGHLGRIWSALVLTAHDCVNKRLDKLPWVSGG